MQLLFGRTTAIRYGNKNGCASWYTFSSLSETSRYELLETFPGQLKQR